MGACGCRVGGSSLELGEAEAGGAVRRGLRDVGTGLGERGGALGVWWGSKLTRFKSRRELLGVV